MPAATGNDVYRRTASRRLASGQQLESVRTPLRLKLRGGRHYIYGGKLERYADECCTVQRPKRTVLMCFVCLPASVNFIENPRYIHPGFLCFYCTTSAYECADVEKFIEYVPSISASISGSYPDICYFASYYALGRISRLPIL